MSKSEPFFSPAANSFLLFLIALITVLNFPVTVNVKILNSASTYCIGIDIFQGCSNALQKFVKGKMAVIGGIGVGIAILQVRNNLITWKKHHSLNAKNNFGNCGSSSILITIFLLCRLWAWFLPFAYTDQLDTRRYSDIRKHGNEWGQLFSELDKGKICV